MLLSELVKLLGCTLDGDGHVDVRRVSGLDEAQPGDVSFLANPKYAKHVQSTRASAVIADQSLTSAPCAVIRSAHPYLTFAQAIAVLTPPALRGRVGAAERVFIGASNELGAFESGTLARFIGTVPAIIVGGVASIAVAGLWALLFPALRRIDRFEDIQPATVDAPRSG